MHHCAAISDADIVLGLAVNLDGVTVENTDFSAGISLGQSALGFTGAPSLITNNGSHGIDVGAGSFANIVNVTNVASVPAQNVVITDNVPGQLTYVAGSAVLNGSANGVTVAGSLITASQSGAQWAIGWSCRS